MKTLNVIGCGHVGRVLSRLWTAHKVLEVRSILNRSLESGSRAVEFVGAGRAVGSYAEMGTADLLMISTGDEAIEDCCRQLSATGLVCEGTIVFHCSGVLPCSVLETARQRGASIASIHPIKSFADPAKSVETFAGTFCALEGDAQACEVLREVFRRCGAITFPVRPEHKTIHHVATVMICNYLVALMEAGLRCFERAGLPRETAVKVMQPIATETLANVFRLGPARALTGPIARGEPSVVAKHCRALARWDEKMLGIYRSLGQIAAELSAAQGHADPRALAAIRQALERAAAD